MDKVFKCTYCGKEFTQEHYEGGAIDHDNFCRNVSRMTVARIIDDLDDKGNSTEPCRVKIQMDKLNSLLIRKDVEEYTKTEVKKHFDDRCEFLRSIFDEKVINEFNFYVKDIKKLEKFAKEFNLNKDNYTISYFNNYPMDNHYNTVITVNGEGYLLK